MSEPRDAEDMTQIVSPAWAEDWDSEEDRSIHFSKPEWQQSALAAGWVPPEEAENQHAIIEHERDHWYSIATERQNRVRELESGWVPPEEAETLREHRRLAEEQTLRLQRAYDEFALRIDELESSWVPPERVETIDCPTFRWVRITERGETRYEAHECPVCYGSGKLQILLSAE